MRIVIDVIDHALQRYPTVGDWQMDWGKTQLNIKVSKMGDTRYESLVALHELIEALLCILRGINEEDVDRFDMAYEKKRKHEGSEGLFNEPGDDPNAPYRKEHFFATTIERLLATEFGVDWNEYDEVVEGL